MTAEERKAKKDAAQAAKKAAEDALTLEGATTPPVAAEDAPVTPPVTPEPPVVLPPSNLVVDVQKSLGDEPAVKGPRLVHVFERLSDGSEVHVRTFSSDPTLNGKDFAKKAEEFVSKFSEKGKDYFIPEQ
jgi:hypothetical protein